jgi:hypothetical protein
MARAMTIESPPPQPSPRVPAVIAGFPTQVEAYEVGETTLGLVSVRDLERHVDRERLLHDETSVPRCSRWVAASGWSR